MIIKKGTSWRGKENITEELKAKNQMELVGRMNNKENILDFIFNARSEEFANLAK